MIEPHSVHAGESAVSKITGAWPTFSRSSPSMSAQLQPLVAPQLMHL